VVELTTTTIKDERGGRSEGFRKQDAPQLQLRTICDLHALQVEVCTDSEMSGTCDIVISRSLATTLEKYGILYENTCGPAAITRCVGYANNV
jgi:hypothetical protein